MQYKTFLIIQGCVGKKTTLLQAEASACASGLANVLFCVWAVHFFLSFCSKLSDVVGFFSLVPNVLLLGTGGGINSTSLSNCTQS